MLQASPLVMARSKSPRGNWGYWVIVELSRDGYKLIHDTHPSRDGLIGEPEDWGILVKYSCVKGIL